MKPHPGLGNALKRVADVLARRPGVALFRDQPATARWHEGARVGTSHGNGAHINSDMPVEMGGGGDDPTAGWYLQAALASCVGTSIAMVAAVRDVELDDLEVVACSSYDTRGMLGLPDEAGGVVSPAPLGIELDVRIRAGRCDAASLDALVQEGLRRSPVRQALRSDLPVTLRITPP